MCVNIWIPINMFTVEYELGSGRPVSDLDMLIMEAIQTLKEPTIDHLANLYHLPSRIIIEVAVTLARSNWITINPNTGGFIVTLYGGKEFNSGNRPNYMKLITKEITIVKECILGQVCLLENIFTKWCNDQRYLIKEAVDARFLTVDEARSVLRHNSDEWIRFIGTPVLVSRGDRTIKVEVDLNEQRVRFLPDMWRDKLEPVLLEKAIELS